MLLTEGILPRRIGGWRKTHQKFGSSGSTTLDTMYSLKDSLMHNDQYACFGSHIGRTHHWSQQLSPQTMKMLHAVAKLLGRCYLPCMTQIQSETAAV